MLGAGVAALALGATAGGLYLAKQHKNKTSHGKLLDDGHGSRGISNLSSCQYVDNPSTSMATIPAPDAVSLGLLWDTQQSGQANMDLLASVFNAQGQNLGYIQGSFSRTLFNGAIWHSGDDVQGGANSELTRLTGDNENIVVDFLKVPPEAACIMIGVLLVQAQSQLAKAQIHISPLLRGEQVEAQYGAKSGAVGSRGVGDHNQDDSGDDSGSEEEVELVTIFRDDLQQHPGFSQQRGFVAGRFLRTGPQAWSWTPVRHVAQADPNTGIWPTLEYYGKPG